MRYGLFHRGRLIRLAPSLRDIMQSRTYSPWSKSCEVYQFSYDANDAPIGVTRI